MRKAIGLVGGVLFLLMAGCNDPSAPDFIKSTGPQTIVHRSIPEPLVGLTTTGGIEVELSYTIQGSDLTVELEGPRNMIADIGLIHNGGGRYTLTDNNKFKWVRPYRPMKIRLPSQHLKAVSIQGFGKVTGLDTLRADRFNIQNYGATEASFIVMADAVHTDLNGAGQVRLSGQARYGYAHVAKTGKLLAGSTKFLLADVELESDRETELSVSDSIAGTMAGRGDLILSGSAKSTIRNIGKGKLLRK